MHRCTARGGDGDGLSCQKIFLRSRLEDVWCRLYEHLSDLPPLCLVRYEHLSAEIRGLWSDVDHLVSLWNQRSKQTARGLAWQYLWWEIHFNTTVNHTSNSSVSCGITLCKVLWRRGIACDNFLLIMACHYFGEAWKMKLKLGIFTTIWFNNCQIKNEKSLYAMIFIIFCLLWLLEPNYREKQKGSR